MNVRLRHVLVLLTPAKHEHLEHTAKNKGVRSDPVFLLWWISEKEKLVFINSALIEYKIGHGGDKE